MAEGEALWSSNSSEQMDVYDEFRRPTGRMIPRGSPIAAGEYLSVVHVCIFNQAGRMLIQQRQGCKKAFPNLWDLTVGGAVQAGETSRDAAAREAREELSLDLDLADARPFLTINYTDGFDDMYVLNREVDLDALHLQESEVQDIRWASLPDVNSLIERGSFVPYHPAFLELLFKMQNRMGVLSIL
jgi:isopentenyldiphosphate isomerase